MSVVIDQLKTMVGTYQTCQGGVLQLVPVGGEPGEVLEVLALQLQLPALGRRLQLTLEGAAQLWVLAERLHRCHFCCRFTAAECSASLCCTLLCFSKALSLLTDLSALGKDSFHGDNHSPPAAGTALTHKWHRRGPSASTVCACARWKGGCWAQARCEPPLTEWKIPTQLCRPSPAPPVETMSLVPGTCRPLFITRSLDTAVPTRP